MKIITALTVIVIFGISSSSCKRYDGYILYRVPFRKDDEGLLRAVIDAFTESDIWRLSLATGKADIIVSPKEEVQVINALKDNGFKMEIINPNVQGLIDSSGTT